MLEQAYRDFRGQGIIPFSPPPCAGCIWRDLKRCSGPRTLESQILDQGDLLSCFEPEKARALMANLERHRPKQGVTFRIIHGLPAAIPVLCEGMPDGLCLGSDALYGIAMDDLLRADGTFQYSSGRHLREAFRLPSDGRICLIASVKDAPLEALWARSATDSAWRRIREFGFEFVTGASFSVYERHSRSGQIFNQERNMLSAEFLAAEGIPVVPIFCEILDEDLSFAARWLEERPEVQVVGGLAQGWRSDRQFIRFLERMKKLAGNVSRQLHFLIIGCSSRRRIPALFRELGSVTVMNTNLALKGVGGRWWDADQEGFSPMPEEALRRDMIQPSFSAFSRFCERQMRSYS